MYPVTSKTARARASQANERAATGPGGFGRKILEKFGWKPYVILLVISRKAVSCVAAVMAASLSFTAIGCASGAPPGSHPGPMMSTPPTFSQWYGFGSC